VARKNLDKLPSLRISRKIGKLDGREGLPDLNVENPHSPFLAELKHVGEQHISQVSQSLSSALTELDNEKSSNQASQSAYERKIKDLLSDVSVVEQDLEINRIDYRGTESESASSRVSDKRYLTGIWYSSIVFLTVIGEVVITYPAFTELFQDTILVAVLATLSASAMTISYSHILGLSLKRNDDKKRRQPRWVMPSLLLSGIPILGLVFALSNVRARKFAPEEIQIDQTNNVDQLSQLDSGSNLEGDALNEDSSIGIDPLGGADDGLSGGTDLLNNNLFEAPIGYWGAFFLFAFLQLALMAVATFASYHHFSNSLAEEERLKNLLAKVRKQVEEAISKKTKLEKDFENSENRRGDLVTSHKSEVENIERKVLARAQAFWGANIRQRSDSPLAKSREFTTPNLQKPDWTV